MNGGTNALLNGADRTFKLTDLTVGRYKVHLDGSDGRADALEFIVYMNVLAG